MALPPLYKYLDVQGAKLTLGNGTFKHAKPTDFNDKEDLTIQSIFPEETEAALTKLSNGFNDVILQHLNDGVVPLSVEFGEAGIAGWAGYAACMMASSELCFC